MTGSPVLDDLELEVVRTLRAKAAQIAVDDAPFRPGAVAVLAPVTPVPARRPRRRTLATAAAVVLVAGLVAGAVGVARLAGTGTAGPTLATGVAYTTRSQGTAGFVAAAVPDGWSLQQMSVGSTTSPGHGARWQLFGSAGSPLARGVLVGTARNDESRVVEGGSRTVHGRPAEVRPSPEPAAPAGAVAASWIEGDVVHDALAVGMDEGELVAFLDALVARDDPAAGFDAPADSPLPEAAAATVEDSYTTTLVYGDTAGHGATVTASSSDRYGGLLHRLAGTPGDGGFVMRGTLGGEPGAPPFASVARGDGWTVDVVGAGAGGAVLDDILASVEPATTRQLVDLGVAQPVTDRYEVGGWSAEVHGTTAEAVAMCLMPASGAPVCTTAEDAGGGRLTAGSALVAGRWVVVTVAPGEAATIRTTEVPPPVSARTVDLSAQGDQVRAGGAVVQLVPVPADVDAVEVMVPTPGGQAVGFIYGRPGSVPS